MEVDSSDQPKVIVLSAPTTRVKRYNRFIRALVCVQLGCGILLIIFGSFIDWIVSVPDSLTVIYRYHGDETNSRTTDVPGSLNSISIWVGLIVVAAAILEGFAFVRKVGHPCLRIGCLAMSITAAVFSGIATIVTGLETIHFTYRMRYMSVVEGHHYIYAVSSLTGICSVVSLFAMISCIIAASLWCYNYCDCCAPRASMQTPGGGAQIMYVTSASVAPSGNKLDTAYFNKTPNGTLESGIGISNENFTRTGRGSKGSSGGFGYGQIPD